MYGLGRHQTWGASLRRLAGRAFCFVGRRLHQGRCYAYHITMARSRCFHDALERADRPIVLSLSPGVEMTTAYYPHLSPPLRAFSRLGVFLGSLG